MFRFGEVFLFIAPALAVALLYSMLFRRLPNRRVVAVLCAVELVLATALIWSGTAEGLRPHERYIPARLQNGAVEEGHGG